MAENKFIKSINDVNFLSETEKQEMEQITSIYPFFANEYYLSLIDPKDPKDPIRKIIIPTMEEIDNWGSFDPSNEKKFTITKGIEHKYHSTALFLISNTCAGICRYCFRKRIFRRKSAETLKDIKNGMNYIKEHKEITNVLLTGGDPMMLGTDFLEKTLEMLKEINHVKIVRIGTRILSYYPQRVSDDKKLIAILKSYNTQNRQLYIITHYSHPREITNKSLKAVNLLKNNGILLANQTPIIKGVNDNAKTLAKLFNQLAFNGIPPYYVFQMRPTRGNKTFAVEIEKSYKIFEEAKSNITGLAKRCRFVMSHSTGKIEIFGLTDKEIIFKYHRAAKDIDSGKIMIFKRNPNAFWLNDYGNITKEYKLKNL